MDDNVEMLIKKNGQGIEMMAAFGSYYKISSDTYECPCCGKRVALPAPSIQKENWQEGYDQLANVIQVDFADRHK